MPAAVLLAFILPIPLGRPAPARTDPQAWQSLEAAFRARGVAVLGHHPRCSEAGLFGLYVRGSRSVVVCPRGDRSGTLRHEGWHLVQSLCLVSSDRWWREPEARAMARMSVPSYLGELNRACAERLPHTNAPM